MEIILDNVYYESKTREENINNVSYTFKNSITFVSGISLKLIKELLFLEKEYLGNVYLSTKGSKKDIAYLGNNPSFYKDNLYNELLFLNKAYKLNYKDLDKKIVDSIKMANLSDKYLSKDFDDMTNNELKLSSLVVALFLNPKVIILDYFEKNLSNNIVEYIKKLVFKLNKMYDKNIIICSNNIDIYLNIIKDIVIFDHGNIVYQGNDLYNNKIYKYIDEPNIINFIKYLDKKGHKFDHYIDIKELLKAIYRDVENK
jgi:energy-coupling factor transporter ATP-binding protein EcfA2